MHTNFHKTFLQHSCNNQLVSWYWPFIHPRWSWPCHRDMSIQKVKCGQPNEEWSKTQLCWHGAKPIKSVMYNFLTHWISSIFFFCVNNKKKMQSCCASSSNCSWLVKSVSCCLYERLITQTLYHHFITLLSSKASFPLHMSTVSVLLLPCFLA